MYTYLYDSRHHRYMRLLHSTMQDMQMQRHDLYAKNKRKELIKEIQAWTQLC